MAAAFRRWSLCSHRYRRGFRTRASTPGTPFGCARAGRQLFGPRCTLGYRCTARVLDGSLARKVETGLSTGQLACTQVSAVGFGWRGHQAGDAAGRLAGGSLRSGALADARCGALADARCGALADARCGALADARCGALAD